MVVAVAVVAPAVTVIFDAAMMMAAPSQEVYRNEDGGAIARGVPHAQHIPADASWISVQETLDK